MPEFDAIRCGALRNSVGNGRVTRIIARHILHDSLWEELAAFKGLTWDDAHPYLIVEYARVKESVDPVTGRMVLDLSPVQPIKAAVYADFAAAQDDYINEARGRCGKTRRKWIPHGLGQGLAEDE